MIKSFCAILLFTSQILFAADYDEADIFELDNSDCPKGQYCSNPHAEDGCGCTHCSYLEDAGSVLPSGHFIDREQRLRGCEMIIYDATVEDPSTEGLEFSSETWSKSRTDHLYPRLASIPDPPPAEASRCRYYLDTEKFIGKRGMLDGLDGANKWDYLFKDSHIDYSCDQGARTLANNQWDSKYQATRENNAYPGVQVIKVRADAYVITGNVVECDGDMEEPWSCFWECESKKDGKGYYQWGKPCRTEEGIYGKCGSNGVCTQKPIGKCRDSDHRGFCPADIPSLTEYGDEYYDGFSEKQLYSITKSDNFHGDITNAILISFAAVGFCMTIFQSYRFVFGKDREQYSQVQEV